MGISNRSLLRNLAGNTYRRLQRQSARRQPGPISQPQSSPPSWVNQSDTTEEPVDWFTWAWEMADSLGKAMDDWKSMATMGPITVSGGIGMINPGDIQGPSLSSLIQMPAVGLDEDSSVAEVRSAINEKVSDGWKTWHSQLSGPLQFPGQVGAPGQQAAASPCLPISLSNLASGGSFALSTGVLKSNLTARFMGKNIPELDDLVDAVSQAVGQTFQTFKTTTMIVNVQTIGGTAHGSPGFLL